MWECAFTFNAVFTLRSMSSIAIDGPIKVPVSATPFLAVAAVFGGLFAARLRDVRTCRMVCHLRCDGHGVEVVGRKLRKLMSWINSKEVD